MTTKDSGTRRARRRALSAIGAAGASTIVAALGGGARSANAQGAAAIVAVNPPSGAPETDTEAIETAIRRCPSGGIVQLGLGTYLVTRTIVIPRTLTMRGFNMRNTSLRWAANDPGANMLLLGGSDTVDNVVLSDFAVDNQGSCGHAIWIATPQRVILERLFSNAARRFETAIVQTNTQLTVFDLVLRDCKFFVSSASEVTPIGVGCATGHTHVIDHCMFSGFRTAVRIGNPSGPQRYRRVDGFTMMNSRVETFSGKGSPGSADAIGVDGVFLAGCHIAGNSFEMAADQDPSSRTQRAIAIREVLGGSIVGNYISGNGVLRSAIEFLNSGAAGIVIHGNTFWAVPRTTAITGHSSFQVQIGVNYYA